MVSVSRLTRLVLWTCVFLLPIGWLCVRTILPSLSLRTDKNASEWNRPHDVILLGYLRGGTTFLGEVLGLHEGNFYMYEPLHSLAHMGYIKPGMVCNMVDSHCTETHTLDKEAMTLLRSIYKCDFRVVTANLHMWQLAKARGTDESWTKVLTECHGEKEEGCMARVLSQCSVARSRVTKVARASMSLISSLLDPLPNLKIIHLIRDPRAIMNSRFRIWLRTSKDLLDASRSLCTKMTEDYSESRRIETKYPGRIMTVFYEDLALNSDKTVKNIFDFLGYTFLEKDNIRLHRMTEANSIAPKNARNFNTHRLNSSVTAGSWRVTGLGAITMLANQVCSALYSPFGYPSLSSPRELRDTNIPLRIQS